MTPLDAYQRRGYSKDKVVDAAVGLTASAWGPPFDTEYSDDVGEWWVEAYKSACASVERAIIDALRGDDS